MARIPKYRRRKDRDSAYVEMNGDRIGLPGPIDSPESLAEYGRLIQEYLREHARNKAGRPRHKSAIGLTIIDLVAEWLAHCKTYYLGSAHTRSNEYDNCRYAVRPLVALFGGAAVAQFTTEEFREVREAMISGNWESEAAKRAIRPWPRTHANAQVNRIKRMFRWGVEHNRCTPDVAGPLLMLSALEAGRSFAKETEPVEPVAQAVVDATLPFLSPVSRVMVELHQLTGMRSDNVCTLRPCDLDRSGDVWIYAPATHKTQHRGKGLVIAFGPRAQAILMPFLDRPADAYCFSPKEDDRTRKRHVRHTAGSYRRAIVLAVRRANKTRAKVAADKGEPAPDPIPEWHPNQLRHSMGTEVWRKHGAEGARVVLGHAHIKTTELYAKRDLELALEIARKMG